MIREHVCFMGGEGQKFDILLGGFDFEFVTWGSKSPNCSVTWPTLWTAPYRGRQQA